MMNIDVKILAYVGGGDLLGYMIKAADSNINIKMSVLSANWFHYFNNLLVFHSRGHNFSCIVLLA